MKRFRENPDSEESQRMSKDNERDVFAAKMEAIFKNCNVCGRELVREDELAVGMCAICANEEIP
jgi:hypothetical protein